MTASLVAALPLHPLVDRWEIREASDDRVHATPVRHGVPIEASATVRLDRTRSPRVRMDPLPDRAGPSTAIARAEAEHVARSTGAGHDPRARLTWQPVGAALRLVWTVDLWDSAAADLAMPSVRIDAATGLILSVRDGAARASSALAYRNNPVVDAGPEEVALPWAEGTLSDAVIAVRPCQDLGEVETFENRKGSYTLRVCTPVGPPALGGLADPVLEPVDPARDEDAFAAPHTYWNLHVGFDWFAALGWAPDSPLEARVNYRRADRTSLETATDPAHALAVFPNAYMTPSFDASPSLVVFGQGDPEDMAYDADLIHHELGHYVIHTARALWSSNPTSYGPSREAQALAEGFCDYFSSAIHGDPVFAEYAGEQGEDDSRSRDLGQIATCADDLQGDPHADSLPFSSALWEVRATLSDPTLLDRALLEALPEIGVEASFAEAVTVLTEQAPTPELADALFAAFAARGVDACVPVIEAIPGPDPIRPSIAVPASSPSETTGLIPAYVQFRVDVPEGGAALTLQYTQRKFLGYDPVPTPLVALGLVGAPGDVVTWTRTEGTGSLGGPVSVWQTDADVLPAPIEVGTHVDPDNPLRELHDYATTWTVPAGRYVFQLTNTEPYDVTVRDPVLTVDPIGSPDSSDPPACGCQAGPTAGGWGLAWMVFARRWRRGVR